MKYLILLFFLLTACTAQITETETIPQFDKLILTTDNQLYHSGDMINIDLNIYAYEDIPDAEIRFYGIHASRNRLDHSQIVDLKQGANTISHNFQAPSCNSCSGIKEGTYQITSELIQNTKLLAEKTTSIEIKQ